MAAWTAGGVAVEILAWLLLRSQGVIITGDSPAYLIAAQALAHLHLDPVPWYRHDLVTHYVYAWPRGATLATSGAQLAYGPHGPVIPHELGVPALLAPATLAASVPGALVWLFALNVGGLVYLHRRTARLAGLGRRARAVLAVAMAAPALVLAATQVYPDLVSGVFAACAFVEMAWVERRRELGARGALVIGLVFAAEPWFEIKNAALVVIGVLALVAICLRARAPIRRLAVIVGAAAASLAALFAYDLYYFGHLLGQAESPERVDATTVLHMAGLLVDRHQGLFVQAPTVLLGLLGLWSARRVAPFSAAAALCSGAAIVVVNGAQSGASSLGGTALAGRFQWTAMPILLGWAAFFVRRVPWRRLAPLAACICGLWLWEGVPVLLGSHTYVNSAIAPFAPWDPSLYPGWWPGVNALLPPLVAVRANLGPFLVRLALELAVWGTAVVVLRRLTRPAPLRLVSVPGSLAPVAAMGLAVAVVGDGAVPPSASWTSSDLASPWQGARAPAEVGPFPLVIAGPGTYRMTVTYRVQVGRGAAAASAVPTTTAAPGAVVLSETTVAPPVVSDWLTPGNPTDAAALHVASPARGARHTVATITLSGARRAGWTSRTVVLRSGGVWQLWLTGRAGPGDTVTVGRVTLR